MRRQYIGLIILAGWWATQPGGALEKPARPAGPYRQDDGAETAVEPPAAPALLAAVIANLPGEPVRVSADLQSRAAGGSTEKTVKLEMALNWGAAEPLARYTLRDAFGASLEAMTLIRQPDGRLEQLFYRGDPLAGAPLPDLYAPIQDLDVSWTDLCLAFLWWPGGQTVGAEKIKGRFCWVVDIPAPGGGTAGYSGVRVWIDPQVRALLQAAAYDRAGETLKTIQIKSFKKVKNVWMVQDLEIQNTQNRHKTVLRVREVKVLNGEGQAVPAGMDTESGPPG